MNPHLSKNLMELQKKGKHLEKAGILQKVIARPFNKEGRQMVQCCFWRTARGN